MRIHNPGSVNYDHTVTGLTNGTVYEFQLVIRAPTTAVLRTFSGSITATKL
jgi:hypothetical protein